MSHDGYGPPNPQARTPECKDARRREFEDDGGDSMIIEGADADDSDEDDDECDAKARAAIDHGCMRRAPS